MICHKKEFQGLLSTTTEKGLEILEKTDEFFKRFKDLYKPSTKKTQNHQLPLHVYLWYDSHVQLWK